MRPSVFESCVGPAPPTQFSDGVGVCILAATAELPRAVMVWWLPQTILRPRRVWRHSRLVATQWTLQVRLLRTPHLMLDPPLSYLFPPSLPCFGTQLLYSSCWPWHSQRALAWEEAYSLCTMMPRLTA